MKKEIDGIYAMLMIILMIALLAGVVVALETYDSRKIQVEQQRQIDELTARLNSLEGK